MGPSLLLASNRGPLSHTDDGQVRRGGGGLVSALGAMAPDDDAVWVCAALTDADRRAARSAPHRLAGDAPTPVRMLDIDPVVFDRAYNQVANSTLWFVAHLLYATASVPVFDERFRRAWAA